MEKQSRQCASSVQVRFDLEKELRKHGWFPKISAVEAEAVLKGQPAFTYLLRKSQTKLRKFDISYVDQKGSVQHDTFTLINPKLGIFRNGQNAHLGELAKVVRDMMHCKRNEGQPLSS